MKFQILHTMTRSFVLEILEEDARYHTQEYSVFIDGKEYCTSDKIIESIYGLTPDTLYQVQIQRKAQLSDISDVVEIRTQKEFVTLNVREFGAKGDGVTNDTMYIQAAILSCPERSRVYIPKGIYLVTTLFLKSNITIELEEGAVLLALSDPSQIPILPGRYESYDEKSEYLLGTWEGEPLDSFASVITGIEVENVTICGRGTLDGNGDFEHWWNVEKRSHDPASRPRMIFLNHCKNIVIQGITIQNSPAWNLHPYFSRDIKIMDIFIQAPHNSHNTDGINPESCDGVDIIGVRFSVGDDCVAIKSGKIYMGKKYKTPSKHITIRNSYMERGHGAVTIGSEIAAGVKHIVIKNCTFSHTDRGLRVKTRRGRGEDSVLQDICCENITMNHVKTPFVINCFYFCDPDGKTKYVWDKNPLPVDERTPKIKDIYMKNILCENAHVAGAYFYGLPEQKIEKIRMEDIHISYAKDSACDQAAMMIGCEKTSKLGIFARNIEKFTLKNVILEGNKGEDFDILQVDEFEH